MFYIWWYSFYSKTTSDNLWKLCAIIIRTLQEIECSLFRTLNPLGCPERDAYMNMCNKLFKSVIFRVDSAATGLSCYPVPEFLKHTDTQTHDRPHFFYLRTILTLNAEFAKQALCHIVSTIWQSFSNLTCFFIAISAHNHAQKFIKQNSDRAKKFTFRMNGPD